MFICGIESSTSWRREPRDNLIRSVISSDYTYFVPLVLIRGDTPASRPLWVPSESRPLECLHLPLSTLLLSYHGRTRASHRLRSAPKGDRDFFGLLVMHEAICPKWPFMTKLCWFYSARCIRPDGKTFVSQARSEVNLTDCEIVDSFKFS